jgi:hypothetical protein
VCVNGGDITSCVDLGWQRGAGVDLVWRPWRLCGLGSFPSTLVCANSESCGRGIAWWPRLFPSVSVVEAPRWGVQLGRPWLVPSPSLVSGTIGRKSSPAIPTGADTFAGVVSLLNALL